MRSTTCTPISAQRWTRRLQARRRLICALAALALSACSFGQRQPLVTPSLPPEPPTQIPGHLRIDCPAVLPTPTQDTGEAVMRAWIAAARMYHRCRESQAALAEAVLIYEQAVEHAYCRALVAARLGVCAD